MRRWLPFAILFAAVFVAGSVGVAVARGWIGGEQRGEPVYTAIDDLDPTVPYVRVSGMAHYTAVVEQHVPGTLFHDPQDYYLYALFPPYDTESRAITVLVRTDREPEDLVSYELMTLEGRVSKPTLDEVPFDTEIILGKQTDYYFSDHLLLIEPWLIEEGLDPRAAPAP